MKWIDPRVDHKYCRKNRGAYKPMRKTIPWFTKRRTTAHGK